MFFPAVFKRYKGTPVVGATALGSDGGASLTTPLSQLTVRDNLLPTKFVNVHGWPIHRVAVVYLAPSGSLALNADMYFWEESIGGWFRINQTSPLALPPGIVTFFDTIALLDGSIAQANLQSGGAGSIAQMLVVTDPGAAPNGLHSFAMGPDLTTYGGG